MAPPAARIVFQDPDFGTVMVRVTDENTLPKTPGSFFRNPPSDANEWSADNSKFYVSGSNTTLLAFAFDPATIQISALPGAQLGGGFKIPLRLGPTFSFVDPDLMYGTAPKAPLVITSFRFSTGQTVPLLDVTTCGTHPSLGGDPKITSGDITTSSDDNRIEISAGGHQAANRPFVVVYDKQLGCRWYNTQTGQVGGQWGPTGFVNIPNRFSINHSRLSGNGQYVRIGVARAGFYIWDVTSLNVQPCLVKTKGLNCSGYGAVGFDSYINAPGAIDELNAYRRPLGDLAILTPLINPLPLPHYLGMEKNFAWGNGRADTNAPICGSTYSEVGDTRIRQPYDDEIICIETDILASTVWRFAHDRVVWDPEYYWTQPYANISGDGRFFIFTSGWNNQVGTTQNGDPRTDVWIVKLD